MTSHSGVDEGGSQNGTERDGFSDSDSDVAKEGADGAPPQTPLGLHPKPRWGLPPQTPS